MPEITVGLAPNRSSYYDKITNVYITLDQPVQTIQFEDHAELENIAHALFSSSPALVLYKGEIPQEAIDQFKAKYMKPFNTDMLKLVRNLKGDLVPPSSSPNRAFDRPDKVNAGSFKEEPENGEDLEEGEGDDFEAQQVKEVAVETKAIVSEEETPEKKEVKKKSTKKKTEKKADTKKKDEK